MFFAFDGNYCRIVCMNHISRIPNINRNRHILLDSIILETKGQIRIVMQVMYDIKQYAPIFYKCFIQLL
jgi:hypothetical protein